MGITVQSPLLALTVLTQILNVQQNNGNTRPGEDLEERMRRIRKAQQESIDAAKKVVDVETEKVEEEKEAEWDF